MRELDSERQRARLQAILKKVRKIEFLTRGKVQEELGGAYHSTFRGQGIDFDEFREYQPGDEVRTIDWNVTARMGTPFVKKFVEDRELTVVLAVDVSASCGYGSLGGGKQALAAETAALLAFSALQNQDKVALLLFSDGVDLFLPPAKGRAHCLRMVREILAWDAAGKGEGMAPALETINRVIDRRSLVFLLSDFQGPDISRSLRLASARHDLVAIQVLDPCELELPKTGWTTLEDPETSEQVRVDVSSSRVREIFQERVGGWKDRLAKSFRKAGIDHLELLVGTDPLPTIHSFFRSRSRRGAG